MTSDKLYEAACSWQEDERIHPLTCSGGGGPCSGVDLIPIHHPLFNEVYFFCPKCHRHQELDEYLGELLLMHLEEQ